MRFVSLFIALCFTFNVLASSGTAQELENLLDDYHYTLSVEWDQKDSTFYENQSKMFLSKLQKLMEERNLSRSEILNLLEKKINNRAAFEAIKLKMSLLVKVNSPEELANVVKEASKSFYAEGASWNGQVIFGRTLSFVLLAAVAYSLWWDANHECVEWQNEYVCSSYSTCYGRDNYCGPSYTTCGYMDVCTRYVEK